MLVIPGFIVPSQKCYPFLTLFISFLVLSSFWDLCDSFFNLSYFSNFLIHNNTVHENYKKLQLLEIQN